MNVKSPAAVMMVVLGTRTFALADDTRQAPKSRLLFPESVERAMMGEGTKRTVPETELPFAERELKERPGWPNDLFKAKPNSAPPAPIGAKSEQTFVPFTPAAAPGSKEMMAFEADVNEVVQQFLREPKADEPIQDLHPKVRDYPNLPREYVLLYYLFESKPTAAKWYLEKALVEYPDDPEPWTILGRIALQDNRNAEADLDFTKAKQLLAGSPDSDHKKLVERDALNGMAQVAERREQWAEAEKRLREYLKKYPEDIDALQRLAHTLFWQSSRNEAYDILKQAKEIDIRNSQKNHTPERMLTAPAIIAQFFDAYERRTCGNTSKNADAWFRYALKQSPRNLQLRGTVAVWALENGETAFAEEQAKQSLRLQPIGKVGKTDAWMLNGLVAMWEKHWSEAESWFDKVLAVEPKSFIARNNLSLALVEQDDPKKKQRALELAQANLNDNLDSAVALSTLAWVHERRGELFGDALANFMKDGGDERRSKMMMRAILETNRAMFSRPEDEKLFEKLKDSERPDAD
jgi:tetratricopeptide (TPR) repeat protein